MDPGFAIGLGVLWVVLNLLGRKKRPPDVRSRPRGSLPPSGPATSRGSDATQVEGMRLQDLLRELGKTLDTAAGAQHSPRKTPGSLETTPQVRSLEEDVRRPQRAPVDSDDEAEAIVAKRIAAAESNLRPLGAADHLAFEARIHQQPADATATASRLPSMRRLREAVVWREILGPPVSLRDSDRP